MLNIYSKNSIKELSEKIGLNLVLTELLVKRGFDTEEKLVEFLEPNLSKLSSPYVLEGMSDAINKIKKHIYDGKILIFGDYDCDGIGASAMLKMALEEHGAQVSVFIPTRIEDGYGLSENSLKRAIESTQPTLIVTVDCGIGSIEEVEIAKKLGVDIVVTDHHEPREILPDCIIVNPKIQVDAPELCGCGVAYMLIRALYGDEYAEKFLDICAISTIADLVPLVKDNRIIAIEGLKRLSGNNVRMGIKSLLNVSGHRYNSPVTSGDIAFKIAPRLNASGRLSNAEKSLKLLISCDRYECDKLSQELENENKKRQELCLETISDARKLLLNYDLINKRIIVLHSDDWEGGVIGIAAAKIAEEFHRPTILFSKKDDVYKGSCRSIAGINIHEVLSGANEYIIQFGGHQMAAGLSVEPSKLDSFIEKANEYIKENYSEELFKLEYHSDANLELKEINLQFVNQLKRLEPFGMGNPKPVFSSVVGALPFERIKRLNHIKCKITTGTELVAFNELDNLETLRAPMTKTIYYNPDKETFMGKDSVRCTFKEMVVNEILPSDREILFAVAERYAHKGIINDVKYNRGRSDALFGKLIITWSKNTYMKLIEQYPNYVRALHKLTSNNPFNTILLAPHGHLNCDYYSEIEVYDNPPESYVNSLINQYSASITVYDNPLDIVIKDKLPDRNTLIKTYNAIRNNYMDKEKEGVLDMYFRCAGSGYNYSYVEFVLGYYVLQELNIIYFDNDIVRFSMEKKDLAQSEILKLSGGKL